MLQSLLLDVLVILSLILAVTTLFPNVDIKLLTEVLSGILMVGLLIAGFLYYSQKGKTNVKVVKTQPTMDRRYWRMPPVNELQKPVWSKTRKLAMILLRGYLLIAV
ncbi:hypothetical protein NDK43_21990 [Neobacillus pocheonensis]|uniref:Uncharacterized protein n=1 Tax=Neobacillus pocheonensis TaxID=363869 RepID=A0ABT0WDY6_9BACI|nr:hypothetical protein [Neobacillus pocheonensis]